MRNALLFVGIGAIVIASGWWYLARMHTVTPPIVPVAEKTAAPQTLSTKTEPVTENQGAAIGDENTVTFKCDGKKTITAVFERDIVGLTLSDGRQMALRQTVSGSGIRYLSNDSKIEFDGKENAGFLVENGKSTYANCIASQ